MSLHRDQVERRDKNEELAKAFPRDGWERSGIYRDARLRTLSSYIRDANAWCSPG